MKDVNEIMQAICRLRTEAKNRGHRLQTFHWTGMALSDPSKMTDSKFKGRLVEAAVYTSVCDNCRRTFGIAWAPGFGVSTNDETTDLMSRDCGKS